ncbi:MAG: YraN family protein [Sphingomonadales bacterium]|nr:YraN family protein [Sphingomonadales bacterium]MDE2170221.1 YraN family protein [Sphingomonadales bacterium]
MSDWRQQADRIAADARGRRGEDEAALFLEGLGFEIVARRVKTPRGEVDLVAHGAGVTIFAEVKWRSSAANWVDAIDQRRLTRVAMAAELLAPRYLRAGDDMRIDVIMLAPGHDPYHIANAWMP